MMHDVQYLSLQESRPPGLVWQAAWCTIGSCHTLQTTRLSSADYWVVDKTRVHHCVLRPLNKQWRSLPPQPEPTFWASPCKMRLCVTHPRSKRVTGNQSFSHTCMMLAQNRLESIQPALRGLNVSLLPVLLAQWGSPTTRLACPA
jgi:hypothetical protein